MARAGVRMEDYERRVQILGCLPTISNFYGNVIRMYFGDHDPPHFHARYGDFEAAIDIRTSPVIRGRLPGRA